MNYIIYDIETIKGFFLLSIYNPKKEEWGDFSINQNSNDLYALLKFCESYSDYYWVGYNNLSFDSQVIQFIQENADKWYDLSNLQISEKIWQFAQDVIDNSNYGLFPIYKESSLLLKQIDLFKINHFDNKNRMVSLKRLEFEMDLENIEEFSLDHKKVDFSKEEIQELINYCHNDIFATWEFLKLTLGDTNHPLYKGNNQIELRKDIKDEFGIDCLNYSDSKIGDEIIKKYYCQEKNIQYYELPKKGFFRKSIKLKYCIAKYVDFKTQELKQFLKKIKSTELGLQDDFKEEIVFYENTYSFMKGGLHTENKPEIFEEDENHIIIDFDVASMYPATIINNEQYPFHLGKEFLIGYKKMFEKRLQLKPSAKKDKKIAGIVGALKLSVNSAYGKSSDMQSWIYDRQLTMFTTITGELSLLMLIEAYELEGIKVISANTDGVTIRIKKELEPKVLEINNWWQEITKYELERTNYKKIIFSTVNDYIAIKSDGEVKKKGDFLTDFELHKNKSARICSIALEQYFVRNIPVEQTIKIHENIYDFCLRAKSSKDFHYEGINKETGETKVYNKLIRYYVANSGEKLLKIKNPECQTNAAPVSEVNAGEWLAKVCNYLPKTTKVENCDINYDFYIEKAQKIIDKIEKRKKINKNQLSLF